MSDSVTVWAVPVLNQGLTRDGTYGQAEVRCTCGYREVVIVQVVGMYGQRHYRHHGVTPRTIPLGWNGADETVHDIVTWS